METKKQTIKLNEEDIKLRKRLLKKAIKRGDTIWEKDLREQINKREIPTTENIRGFILK